MLGQKLLVDAVIKIIKKTFKFDKVLDYVEKPNELDEEMKHVKSRLYSLEKMSHPPRDFVICDECKCKVVITEHIEERKK